MKWNQEIVLLCRGSEGKGECRRRGEASGRENGTRYIFHFPASILFSMVILI